jgi:Negative regulator of sigma F
MTAVMPSGTSATGLVNRPSTSNGGVVSSIASARLAASSGDSKGTRYSSANSASVVSQFASFAVADCQNTVGYGCLTDWVSVGADGVHMGEAVRCFATLVLTSAPLTLAMVVMLRHAALLRAAPVALCGSLAVAAITSSALSLLHDLDATIMVLIWNLGTAALILGFGAAFGRKVFAWIAARMIPGRIDAMHSQSRR